MDKRNLKIIYSNYSGAEKKAIELVNREVGEIVCRDAMVYTIHVIALEKDGAPVDKNVILIGKYSENKTIQKYVNEDEIPQNGYLVKIFDNPENENLKITVITAHSSVGVFYAAVDYADNYLPSAAKNMSNHIFSDYNTFDDKIPDYVSASAPKTDTRSIFTWGQPVNDYREFIDNAARCRINQLIVWNDFLPLNAADVVAYAHEYEMELIWGFAWGWSTNCDNIDLENLGALKEEIVSSFKNNYMSVGDGIYFQSFTELHKEDIGGVVIAKAVTEFVNDVAAEIFKIKPDAKIQFGLHAMSVKSKLEYIENIDKRLEIVWEGCGSFPYGYSPKITSQEDFDEALAFTEKIVNLRGRGKTGLVYKGLMTLDWNRFAHQSGHYIMGENSEKTADNDRAMLAPAWRKFTADWLVYGKYVYDFTKKIHETDCKNINLNVAAQLAGGVWFPFALLAEMLWSTDDSYDEILNRVSKRKNVIF